MDLSELEQKALRSFREIKPGLDIVKILVVSAVFVEVRREEEAFSVVFLSFRLRRGSGNERSYLF